MSRFIVFEGVDGAGKTTIANKVYEELLKQKKKVILTREPGGSILAEQLRGLILSNETDAVEELLLMSAARHNHYRTKIKPALDNGCIVLCDRWMYSSYAYQGILGGLNFTDIENVTNLALGSHKIDPLILVFLVTYDEAQNRMKVRNKDKFESILKGTFNALYTFYEKIDNAHLLDGLCDPTVLTKHVLELIEKDYLIE
jgi:dTMP kinase